MEWDLQVSWNCSGTRVHINFQISVLEIAYSVVHLGCSANPWDMNYEQVWPEEDPSSHRCCRWMSWSQTVSVVIWALSSNQGPSPSQVAADGRRRQAGALTCPGRCARWWRGSFPKGTLEARGQWVVAGRPKRPCNAGATARPSLPSSLCFGSWNKWGVEEVSALALCAGRRCGVDYEVGQLLGLGWATWNLWTSVWLLVKEE